MLERQRYLSSMTMPTFASIAGLLKVVGLLAETFDSAAAFLSRERSDEPSCLVLDFTLAGRNGFEVQRELVDAGLDIPVIFISGYDDVSRNRPRARIGCGGILDQAIRGSGPARCDSGCIESRSSDASEVSDVAELSRGAWRRSTH